MYWVVLIASGVLEAVWATALSASKGFRRLWPVVVFAVSMTLSVVGLAWAMRGIPVGTAYAVWVGVGAVLTVLVAVLRGEEKLGVARALLLVALVGCVAGLKVVS
ncbi:DMT family transporter [Lentzea sp. NPDC092896]|uniref:DMT family transporter n=1 Tax=Lentzea sp. NPDC092896 TaxID=3364127 RepID=UPI003809A492